MNIPDEYLTGNKELDKKIVLAWEKEMKRPWNKKVISKTSNSIPVNNSSSKIRVAGVIDRTYSDGTIFASQGEMNRWDYLLKLQMGKEIKDLQRQVSFVLQESFINKQWGDIPALTYVADFVYMNISYRKGYEGKIVVEDAKGAYLTPVYKIKRKLFLHKFAEYPFFEV